MARIASSIDHTLTGRVYDSFIRLPLKLGYRDDGIQSLRDLDRVREFLSSLGPVALLDLPWIPVYLLVCFAFHVWIGIAALSGAIVLVGLTLVTEQLTRKPSLAASRERCRQFVGMGGGLGRSDGSRPRHALSSVHCHLSSDLRQHADPHADQDALRSRRYGYRARW